MSSARACFRPSGAWAGKAASPTQTRARAMGRTPSTNFSIDAGCPIFRQRRLAHTASLWTFTPAVGFSYTPYAIPVPEASRPSSPARIDNGMYRKHPMVMLCLTVIYSCSLDQQSSFQPVPRNALSRFIDRGPSNIKANNQRNWNNRKPERSSTRSIVNLATTICPESACGPQLRPLSLQLEYRRQSTAAPPINSKGSFFFFFFFFFFFSCYISSLHLLGNRNSKIFNDGVINRVGHDRVFERIHVTPVDFPRSGCRPLRCAIEELQHHHPLIAAASKG